MDERDGWWLCAAVGCLAVGHLLHLRFIAALEKRIAAVEDEVTFLRGVARTFDEESKEKM